MIDTNVTFLDVTIEETALAYALKNVDTWEDCLQIINVELFEDKRHKALYEATVNYYNQFQGIIDDKGLEVMLDEAKATAEKKTTCSMIIKSAASQHPTCGHTGLPIHKVYQDEHGNCQPLYRKDMPQKYEVSTFNTHKILG